MNRKLKSTCSAAVLAGMLFPSTSAYAQAEFSLRWAHYLAPGTFLEVEEEFARKVEERTGGRVEFDIAYSGALGSGTEVLSLTGRGGVDMSAVVPGYYPDQMHYWKASQIPFVFDSPAEAIEVVLASVKEIPAFLEEMEQLRVHFLFQQPLGSFYLTGASPECDTIAGIAGKKVRAFGADIPQIMDAAGAVPLTIAVVEIYEALQRGTLDYSFLNLGNIAANRLQEVGRYTCGPIMSVGGHMVLMSKGTWDGLPEDIQAIITEEAAVAQDAYLAWLEENDQATVAAIEAGGGEVKPFQPADLAEWREATPDLLQGWVDTMTERGEGENAEAVAALWREMTAE